MPDYGTIGTLKTAPAAADLIQLGDGATGVTARTTIASITAPLASRFYDVGTRAVELSLTLDKTGVTHAGTTLDTIITAAPPAGYDGWRIPKGTYLISALTEITVVRSINVDATDATFVFSTDSDGIRFRAGDLNYHDVTWRGGFFDLRSQPVSTSVPFGGAPFPAGTTQGVSVRTDALLFVSQLDANVEVIGALGHVEVTDATFVAHADHWELAGGDSAIFVSTCKSALFERNTFIGIRDLGIYMSADYFETSPVSPGGNNAIVRNNEFRNCAGGAAIKRGGLNFQVIGNRFSNCWQGAAAETVGTSLYKERPFQTYNVIVTGNLFNRCHRGVAVEHTSGVTVSGNIFGEAGLDMDDMVTEQAPRFSAPGVFAPLHHVEAIDCETVYVRDNQYGGKHASSAGATLTDIGNTQDPAKVVVWDRRQGTVGSSSGFDITLPAAPPGGEIIVGLSMGSARTLVWTGSPTAVHGTQQAKLARFPASSSNTTVNVSWAGGNSLATWWALGLEKVDSANVAVAESVQSANTTTIITTPALTPGVVPNTAGMVIRVATTNLGSIFDPVTGEVRVSESTTGSYVVAQSEYAGATIPALDVTRTNNDSQNEVGLTVYFPPLQPPAQPLFDDITLPARTTQPAAPLAGSALLYVREIAGASVVVLQGPNGREVDLQASYATNRIGTWSPQSGTAVTVAGMPRTAVGTTSHPAITLGSRLAASRRWRVASATTANSAADERSDVALVGRGSAAGVGGFTYSNRVAVTTQPATTRCFFGLSSSLAAISTSQDPQALTNVIGIGFNLAIDANWQILHNDGAGVCTKINLGASFPSNSLTNLLNVRIHCPPFAGEVGVEVINETTGVSAVYTLSTDLPAQAQVLSVRNYANNGGTASTVHYECTGVYIESDY